MPKFRQFSEVKDLKPHSIPIRLYINFTLIFSVVYEVSSFAILVQAGSRRSARHDELSDAVMDCRS